MIAEEDVITVAVSLNMEVTEDEIAYVLRNFEYVMEDSSLWYEAVKMLLYQLKSEGYE